MSDADVQARLRELHELLGKMIEEPGPGGSGGSHWHMPVLPPPGPDGRISSTDILSWWFHKPPGAAHPWEEYFAGPAEPAPPVVSDPPAAAGGGSEAVVDASVAWEPFFTEVDDDLPDEDAQAAVDCLYDFLRAVARRDVAAAMATVAEDYHAMEDDREVDRLKLRHGLESYLDSVRGWELDVSLSEAPRPVGHPEGVLIAGDIQMDALDPSTGERSCRVERRVAVLRRDAGGEWKIHALSVVER